MKHRRIWMMIGLAVLLIGLTSCSAVDLPTDSEIRFSSGEQAYQAIGGDQMQTAPRNLGKGSVVTTADGSVLKINSVKKTTYTVRFVLILIGSFAISFVITLLVDKENNYIFMPFALTFVLLIIPAKSFHLSSALDPTTPGDGVVCAAFTYQNNATENKRISDVCSAAYMQIGDQRYDTRIARDQFVYFSDMETSYALKDGKKTTVVIYAEAPKDLLKTAAATIVFVVDGTAYETVYHK